MNGYVDGSNPIVRQDMSDLFARWQHAIEQLKLVACEANTKRVFDAAEAIREYVEVIA